MNINPWRKNKSDPKVLEQEVSKLSQELASNSIETQDLRSRLASAVSGGYDQADTLHNVFIDYGYPQKVTFENTWNMYRRFGIAKNIAELPVITGWTDNPRVEGVSAEFEILCKRTKLWQRLKSLDNRQRVGRYAGLFMRFRDGLQPEQPIQTKGSGQGALVSMTPMYEGQLKVLETDTNPASENYGLPTMYQYTSGGAGDKNDKEANSFNIHPDRIIIAAEGADDGGIYGVSVLEACYNSLMDLRKIIGAGGEGFYKNAAQSIIFQLVDGASAKANETLLDKFNEKYNEFIRNRNNRSLWTPGLEPKVLDSNLTNPEGFFNSALSDIAAASRIPATIISGKQTGRLASDQDSKQFLSGINSRRNDFQTEIVSKVIDWFMKNGVIAVSDYEIIWSDLLALSANEKLENAIKMSETNQKQYMSGGTLPFTGEEIRLEAGYETEDFEEEVEGEELDDIDEIEESGSVNE